MAFLTITSGQIAAGEPTTQELFQTIKDNFDDHESRIGVVEGTIANYVPIDFTVVGAYSNRTMPQTGVLYFLVPFSMTLTGAKIYLTTAGTAGTLECDLLYKRGGAAYTTIFSTKPSLAYTAGDNAVSSNAVFAVTSLEANDRLRFDITSSQTATPGNFALILSFTKT